jgi:uncharacterized protein (TIGR03663 family)
MTDSQLPGQLPLIDVPPPPRPEDRTPDPDDHPAGLPPWVNLRNTVIALGLFGLTIRLASLGARPFHHDESLDAWFSWRVLNGDYEGYDPVYHGPLRFYLTASIFWLIGESETTARLLAAFSGAVVVVLPWYWRKDLGSVGTIAAVGLAAVSPSLLYFSRVGREDSFFLALTFATVLVFVAFLTRPKPWHPTALFMLLVASIAVKESLFMTVFIFGALGMVLLTQDLVLARGGGEHAANGGHGLSDDSVRRLTLGLGLALMIVAFLFGEPIIVSLGFYGLVLGAAIGLAAWHAVRRGAELTEVPVIRSLARVPFYWWLTAVWVSIVAFIMFFTGFFTNFGGAGTESAPYGSIENGLRAGFEYWRGEQDTVRGDARWQYYLAVIPAYEWFILALSTVGIARVIRRPTLVGQTLVWWGTASFTVHSWAGERMPWLMIHPLLPFVMLAGLGVQVLWDNRGHVWRVPVGVALALGLLWTLNTSYQASYHRGGEPQELFVQAGQATSEVPDWVDRLYLLDRLVMAEEGRHLTVSIDSDVYWPYGWYLRDFPSGTFAVLDTDSDAPDSDVIFVPHWEQAAIGGQLNDYTTLPYEHRWWWVPDFDVGPRAWGRWLWDRQPWQGTDDNQSDCPGILEGEVYMRNSVYSLEQEYLNFPDIDLVRKPRHGSEGAQACERPDVAALGG